MCEEDVARIVASLHSTFKEGDKAYLLSNKWFFQLKRAVRNKLNFDLLIDNSHLLEAGEVKQVILSPQDYHVVTEAVWMDLIDKFGGGPEIAVPCHMDPNKQEVVPDVIPISFMIYYDNQPHKIFVHRLEKVSDLLMQCKKQFQLDARALFRLRDYRGGKANEYLDENMQIVLCNLAIDQPLLLEKESIQESSTARSTAKETDTGMFMLTNMGNMCYINTILQCLFRTKAMQMVRAPSVKSNAPVTYEFKKLMQMCMNRQFGEHQYWNPMMRSYMASVLKNEIARKDANFADWMQKDAHEFLSSLMNILLMENGSNKSVHATGDMHGNGSNDQEIADKFWNYQMEKYDSTLFELIHGMRQIVKECTSCHRKDVWFELQESILLEMLEQKSILEIAVCKFDLSKDSKSIFIPRPENNITLENLESIVWKNINELPNDRTFIFAYDDSNTNDISVLSQSEIASQSRIYAFEIPSKAEQYFIVNPNDRKVRPFLCKYNDFSSYLDVISKRLGVNISTSSFMAPLLGKCEVEPYCEFLYLPAVPLDVKCMSSIPSQISMSSGPSHGDNIETLLHHSYCTHPIESVCDYCQCQEIEKSTMIWKVPDTMILYIGRFRQTETGLFEKNQTFVDFGETLDMSKFVSGPRQNGSMKYKLIGYACHIGQSCISGHYHAYIKSKNGLWYKCSDTIIDGPKESLTYEMKKDAYILFYEREQ